MSYKDDRGRYHEYYLDCSAANRRYREEKEQGAAIASAAKFTAIQSARAAEAAEEQTKSTRKQNLLLEEQNRLLMMTPEERYAYKKKLEEDERREQEAAANARLEEQRRKDEEADYWSSPAGVEARKQARQESLAQEQTEVQEELHKLKSQRVALRNNSIKWGGIGLILTVIGHNFKQYALLNILGFVGLVMVSIIPYYWLFKWISIRTKILGYNKKLVAALAEQKMQQKPVAGKD
jgi:hypothetical protein